jgi:hypothetical protein
MSDPLSTVRARAALAGIALHHGRDHMGRDVFLVSRWNMSRTFATLQQVENWLEMVTGSPSRSAQ